MPPLPPPPVAGARGARRRLRGPAEGWPLPRVPSGANPAVRSLSEVADEVPWAWWLQTRGLFSCHSESPKSRGRRGYRGRPRPRPSQAHAPPRPSPLPGPRSSPALKTAEAPVAPWLVAASLRPPPLASHDSPGPLIFWRGRGPLDLGHALGDSLTRCGFVLVTSVDVGWGRGTLCSPALGRRQSTKVRGWAAPGRWTATRPPARVGREEARDVTGALLTSASAG